MDFIMLIIVGIMILNLIRHVIKSCREDKEHERLYKQRNDADK